MSIFILYKTNFIVFQENQKEVELKIQDME